MRPIAIMAAMESEIIELRHALTSDPEASQTQDTTAGMRDYYAGTLWGAPVVLAFSRWGKVAAASTAMHLLHHYNPTEVIFTGVAGSIDPNTRVGDVVIGTTLVQHDMDASPIFDRYELPLLGLANLPATTSIRERLAQAAHEFITRDIRTALAPESIRRFAVTDPQVVLGQIASGDQFISGPEDAQEIKSRLPDSVCVEMEGAAVAQVCFEHSVDFGVVRIISDQADSSADIDFPAFVSQVASNYSHGILRRYLAER